MSQQTFARGRSLDKISLRATRSSSDMTRPYLCYSTMKKYLERRQRFHLKDQRRFCMKFKSLRSLLIPNFKCHCIFHDNQWKDFLFCTKFVCRKLLQILRYLVKTLFKTILYNTFSLCGHIGPTQESW